MTSQTTVRRRVAALVLAGACLPAAAACGGDDEPSEAQETTTTVTPETTAPPTTLTKEQEVEAALRDYSSMMNDLGAAPNPDDPRLPELVVEPQLTEIRQGLRQRQASNQVYEIGPLSGYEVIHIAVDPTGLTATVLLCAVGADKKIDLDTGDVVADGVYTTKNELSYRRENERWMLADFQNLRSWEGVTTCDE